jgi:hypothetical protein
VCVNSHCGGQGSSPTSTLPPKAMAAMKPVGPPPAGCAQWAVPRLSQSWSIQGGYVKKEYALTTQEIAIDVFGNESVFVKIDKSGEWLYKMVSGNGAQRGALKRTTVISVLKERLEAAVAAERMSELENGGEEAADADHAATEDPMEALMEPALKKRKAKYLSKRGVGSAKAFRTVKMPEVCPLAYPNRVMEQRTVTLLPTGNNSLWIIKEDLDWLLKYLADEAACGGVARTESAAVAAANTEVPGLYVQWDFDSDDAYDGVFVSGPLKEMKYRCKVSTLTPAKWHAVGSLPQFAAMTFDTADEDGKKMAAKCFLEMHCAAQLATAAAEGGCLTS